MARTPYRLAPAEIEIIKRGKDSPSIITDYFFRPKGADHGFIFDYNFTEEGAWQEAVCLAEQKTIVVIGGVGTGKTLGVGMGAVAWAIAVEDFMFLNAAQKAWQAKLMYDLILKFARNTPFEDLIWEKPRRPHPKIILKFYVGDILHESSLEFMSVDRDATGLFSWRGDWINIEEAGLLDNLDEIWANLATRMTGSTPRGRSFLGRLSAISNPWDVPYLWYLFDMASSEPEDSLSMVLSTRQNRNVSDEQMRQLLKRLPEDEHSRFIDGARPEGKGNFFSKESVAKCENALMTEILIEGAKRQIPGYSFYRAAGIGPTSYETPVKKDRVYMVLGDPGVLNPPARNSPVVMAWDVTEFPKRPAVLVAYWWGYGHGKIYPFVNKILDWKDSKYAVYTGVDSTSTQTYMAEIINLFHFSDDPAKGIHGLDFSGSKKSGYLVVLRSYLESGMMQWPSIITGIRSQLLNYDLVADKRLAQDLVATMAMSAWAMRVYFQYEPEPAKEDQPRIDPGPLQDRRLSTESRNKRSVRARAVSDHQ